ncbi:RNF139.2 family protein [Megaselia abdita]
MATAKITKCKHFFHGVCLRKWLYVQDRCPLCHEIMMYIENKPEDKLVPHRPDDHDENNEIQDVSFPQTSGPFNQFTVGVNDDVSSAHTRSPQRIQGIAISSTSSASLHFRMSPAGGGEIPE